LNFKLWVVARVAARRSAITAHGAQRRKVRATPRKHTSTRATRSSNSVRVAAVQHGANVGQQDTTTASRG